MDDRRRDSRHDVHWPVRVAHREDGCLYGSVANVSAGGVLFTVNGHLAIGELVEAEIAVNPLFTIRCAIRIVRSREIQAGEWAYGAEFVQLAASDAKTVLALLLLIRPSEDDTPLSHRPKSPLPS